MASELVTYRTLYMPQKMIPCMRHKTLFSRGFILNCKILQIKLKLNYAISKDSILQMLLVLSFKTAELKNFKWYYNSKLHILSIFKPYSSF